MHPPIALHLMFFLFWVKSSDNSSVKPKEKTQNKQIKKIITYSFQYILSHMTQIKYIKPKNCFNRQQAKTWNIDKKRKETISNHLLNSNSK